ncbi:MAG: DNA cytosine methyltransferase [Pseudomonadota bacterium]
MLRVLDLFSGIGGFSLGLERTGGFETIGFCEIEPFPRAVLAKHWPDVPIHDDVRTLDREAVGPVDVIVGGFPCQPFSAAGKRRGTSDDRHLWPEMLRLIAELRPTWVVGENVAGFVSMVQRRDPADVESRTGGRNTQGADFTTVAVRAEHMLLHHVCDDLDRVGYAVQPFVVPACAVDAPHRRDRVWIVAHDGGLRRDHRGTEHPLSGVGLGSEASVADAASIRCQRDQPIGRSVSCSAQERGLREPARDCEVMADTDGTRQPQQHRRVGQKRRRSVNGGEEIAMADAGGVERHDQPTARSSKDIGHKPASGCRREATLSHNGPRGGEGSRREIGRSAPSSRWEPEPDVGRVAHGVPNRVDRLRALGNAVVPQVVEMIGLGILAAEAEASAL